MPSVRQSIQGLAALATLLLPVAQAKPFAITNLFKRVPNPIPSCATPGDIKWQPGLDFDTDGCYNTPAIGPDGTLNEGMDNCYTTGESGCRDESDLDGNNVYSRARCNNGWCAYMYGYYFEKDVALTHVCGVGAGHRHEWEHIVIWTQNDEAKFVAAGGHGEYDVRGAGDVLWEDSHPKIVYHKDSASTHVFRFGTGADDGGIENHKGVWFRGALISWEGFPDNGLRDTMVGNDWGNGKIDFSDARFAGALEQAKGGNDIALDVNVDDGSPGEIDC